MYNAIKEVLSLKYNKCVLIGTDIPEINKDDIINAFNLLKNNDFVFGASYDGGYYLVGMKEANDIIFKSGSGNLKDIINIVEANNLKYGLTNKKHDIDDYEDLIDLSKRININDNKLKNTKKSISLYQTFLKEYPKDDYVPRIYNIFLNESLNANNLISAKRYLTNSLKKFPNNRWTETSLKSYLRKSLRLKNKTETYYGLKILEERH